jgi:GNAT superfamily N-acetyltransferase
MLDIHPSSRKHGVAEEDIEHAVTHATAIDDTRDDARLQLGRARNAALLEVLTIPAVEGSELAIHAMRMRPKYRYLLPER